MRSLFTACLAVALALPAQALQAGGNDARAIVEALSDRRDSADPALFYELADMGSREGLDGLLEAYDLVSSIYMRREVVRALSRLDGVDDLQHAALLKITEVATGAKERELREGAIDALGECGVTGKHYLARIVESPAWDPVRERALDRHIALATEADHPFYRALYDDEEERRAAEKEERKKEKKARKDGDETTERRVHRLQSLRRKAFKALSEVLADDEVVHAATEEKDAGIRLSALNELYRRGHRRTEEIAREVLARNAGGKEENRIAAAKVLAEQGGDGEADAFFDLGSKSTTPDVLRRTLADLLAEFESAMVKKKLTRAMGKGKPYERKFVLRAARRIDDPKVTKGFVKALTDKEESVRLLAVQLLAERADPAVAPEIRELMQHKKFGKGEAVLAGIDALAVLLADDPAWDEELVGYLVGDSTETRNAALTQLGKRRDGAHTARFAEYLAHPAWSTRLAALQALEGLATTEAVDAIVARMPQEVGRLLNEFSGSLFRLTGESFKERHTAWKGWWADNREGFVPISTDRLAEREREEEERILKQTSSIRAAIEEKEIAFFGIRILSHQAIFIIDVSGSMAEPTRSEFIGERPESRMDVARRELKKCIEALPDKALFNVVAFSGDVSSWLDGGVVMSDQATREAALEWVDRLGALGGTNLFAALELAFDDPEVDTIFVLSDGEPSVGEIVDPFLIREEVKYWNKSRGVKINSISVGAKFQILEWLAEDSGGSHIEIL